MKFNNWKGAAALAVAVAATGVWAAQAPTPGQKAPTPPAQKATPPSGIQTLPVPSAKDMVTPEEVVLTIGNEKITRERFEAMRRSLPPQYAQAGLQMDDKAFANTIATYLGLALQAERDKLDQSGQFKEQLNFLRTELLAQLALNHMRTTAQVVSADEVKAYYGSHTEEFQQARVKAILVALNPQARPAAGAAPAETPKPRTDEEAKNRALDLRKQLLAGADFATLAKAHSDDPASSEKGGDFGNIRKNQLPANLQKVIFALKPKEISEPVRENQGYYLFQVEEIRPVTLDEATASIRNTMQQEKVNAAMAKVRTDFPVVMNDRFFADAQPAPGSPARPVITGVAPGQPGAAGTPAPAAKQPAPAPAAKQPAPAPATRPQP